VEATLDKKKISCKGLRFSLRSGRKEIGRAYLYFLKNDPHQRHFGFMEDVFVDTSSRGLGSGRMLVEAVIQEARRQGCYKLIANSREGRPRVHKLYKKLGFTHWGHEFRIDL